MLAPNGQGGYIREYIRTSIGAINAIKGECLAHGSPVTISCPASFPFDSLLSLDNSPKIRWMPKILHDPKYNIYWEERDYCILRSCRNFSINSRIAVCIFILPFFHGMTLNPKPIPNFGLSPAAKRSSAENPEKTLHPKGPRT